ncbi:MAG: HYR domain-containing protein, partial [Planctomycetota bacterium]
DEAFFDATLSPRGSFVDPRGFAPALGFDENPPLAYRVSQGGWVRVAHPASDESDRPRVIRLDESTVPGGAVLIDRGIHNFGPVDPSFDRDWYEIQTSREECQGYSVRISITYYNQGGELEAVGMPIPGSAIRIPGAGFDTWQWTSVEAFLDRPFLFEVTGDDNYYSLRVELTELPLLEEDPFESNDDFFEATRILPNDFVETEASSHREYSVVWTQPNLHCPDDEDVYLVELPVAAEDCIVRGAECGFDLSSSLFTNVRVIASRVDRFEVLRYDESLYETSRRTAVRIGCPRSRGMARFWIRVPPQNRPVDYTIRISYRVPLDRTTAQERLEQFIDLACCQYGGALCDPGFPVELPPPDFRPFDFLRLFGELRLNQIFDSLCLDGECAGGPTQFMVVPWGLGDLGPIELNFDFLDRPLPEFEAVLFSGAGIRLGEIEPISQDGFRWGLSAEGPLPNEDLYLRVRGLAIGTRYSVEASRAIEAPELSHSVREVAGDGCGEARFIVSVQSDRPVSRYSTRISFGDGPAPTARSVDALLGGTAQFTEEDGEVFVEWFAEDFEDGGSVDLSNGRDLLAITVAAPAEDWEICLEAPVADLSPSGSYGGSSEDRDCLDVSGSSDEVAPTIVCPEEWSLEPHPDGAVISFEVEASDDCSEVTVVCVPDSGTVIGFGATIVECTATDAAGNETICEFEVFVEPTDVEVRFRRGDSNGDGRVDLADAVNTLGVLFLGGVQPNCRDAADADDNGNIDITDAVKTLNFLFIGGAPPSAPGPRECGVDPSEDDLPECRYESC